MRKRNQSDYQVTLKHAMHVTMNLMKITLNLNVALSNDNYAMNVLFFNVRMLLLMALILIKYKQAVNFVKNSNLMEVI